MTMLLLLLLAPQDPDPKKVDRAIEKGAEWLLKQKLKPLKDFPGGFMRQDELVLYTLFHAGADRQGEAFQALLKNVLETPLQRTYSVSLQAMLLSELDPAKYRGRLRECGQFLVDNQARNGQWHYGKEVPPDRDVATEGGSGRIRVKRRAAFEVESGDNSCSQYAALGLRACMEANIFPPDETLRLARDGWVRSQNRDGGWGYGGRGDPSRGSMTAGAVASLVIYKHYLGEKWTNDASVGAGVLWLIKNWSVKTNPGHGDEWRHYYLYAVERTGILTRRDKFASIDWYREGANFLLETQNPDGWWSEGESWGGAIKDTCFAILFLRRSTAPLVPVATPTGASDPLGGVGVNFNSDDKTPTAASLKELGVTVVRSPFYGDLERLKAALEKMGREIRVVLVVDSQTVAPADDAPVDSEEYARRLAKKSRDIVEKFPGRILAIEVWNEPDNKHESAVSIYLAPATYARLLLIVYTEVKAADKKVQVLVGGLVTGQPQYLKDIRAALPKDAKPYDGVAVHPYGKSVPGCDYGPFGPLKELLDLYLEAGEAPLWLTEIGAPLEEFPGKDARELQATYFRALVRELKRLGAKKIAFWSLHGILEDLVEHGTAKSFSIYEDGKLNPLGKALVEALKK